MLGSLGGDSKKRRKVINKFVEVLLVQQFRRPKDMSENEVLIAHWIHIYVMSRLVKTCCSYHEDEYTKVCSSEMRRQLMQCDLTLKPAQLLYRKNETMQLGVSTLLSVLECPNFHPRLVDLEEALYACRMVVRLQKTARNIEKYIAVELQRQNNPHIRSQLSGFSMQRDIIDEMMDVLPVAWPQVMSRAQVLLSIEPECWAVIDSHGNELGITFLERLRQQVRELGEVPVSGGVE